MAVSRIRLIVLAAILAVIVAVNLWFIIPGFLADKPLVGTPNSDAIYTSGGFHCPGDGPNRIHYHTCEGAPVALPEGTKPTDFPDQSQ